MKKQTKAEWRMKNNREFNYTLDFQNINFRAHPELYRIGRGEQGVLLVEPYKSEILPHWRFRTVELARNSSQKIYEMFLEYLWKNDFVGADMARKFLQMGYTRARRYANHRSGKKYGSNPQKAFSKENEAVLRKNILPQEKDFLTNEKAEAARIFYEKWKEVRGNTKYLKMKADHLRKYLERNPKIIPLLPLEFLHSTKE